MRHGGSIGLASAAVLVAVMAGAIASPARAQDRLLALQWEGQAQPSAGVATRAGDDQGRWNVALTIGSVQCTGTLAATAAADGTWALACPDGVTASGRYRETANGSGEGSGTDSRGRKITFVVDAPVRGAGAMPQRAPVATTSSTVCGPIEISGLNITTSTIKCSERKESSTLPSASAMFQSLTFVWGSEFMSISYNRIVGRAYYKEISEDEIKRRLSGYGLDSINDASITAVQSSPFRHVRFEGRTGKSPLGCAAGYFSTEQNAEGNRNLIWVLYCKAAATQITDDGLTAAYRAIKIKS